MVHGIDKCDTREEAKEFMRLYFAENPHFYANVGYVAGYCSQERMRQIFDWFETAHPIFGTHQPTPEEAFKAGQLMAERKLD